MSNNAISGIVLAGGRSSRFGTDKALATVKGSSSLVRIVRTLKEICKNVTVTTHSSERSQRYSETLKISGFGPNESVFCLPDNVDLNCSGPLKGMITGLLASRGEYVIIVPCDIPFVTTNFLSQLSKKSQESNTVVVPMWSDGRFEPQILALPRECLANSCTLLGKLVRSRADDIIRGSPAISIFPLWKYEQATKILVNLNEPERFQERRIGTLEKILPSIREDIDLPWSEEFSNVEKVFDEPSKLIQLCRKLHDDHSWFWSGVLYLSIGNRANDKVRSQYIEAAAASFMQEADLWSRYNLPFLHRHALIDAINADSRLSDEYSLEISNLSSKMNLKRLT